MPLYNMDKIKESYELYRRLDNDVFGDYTNSYIHSCSSYLGDVEQNIYDLYVRIGKGIVNVGLRWNEIITAIEDLDAQGANDIEKSIDDIYSDTYTKNFTIGETLDNAISGISTSTASIKLGSEVGNYNVTKGHDTATWAVDGKNVEDLNTKHVTEESKFMRFAVVNEDGSIGQISDSDGKTLEDFCKENNVTPDRVAVDVGSKDGKSQAWVSVKELTDGVTSTSATNSGMQNVTNASTTGTTANSVNTTGASSQSTPSTTNTSTTNASQANTVSTSDTSTTTNINSIVGSVKDASSSIQNKATATNTSQADSSLNKLSDADALKNISEAAQKATENVFSSNKQSLDDMDPEARKMLTPDVEKALQNLNNQHGGGGSTF